MRFIYQYMKSNAARRSELDLPDVRWQGLRGFFFQLSRVTRRQLCYRQPLIKLIVE